MAKTNPFAAGGGDDHDTEERVKKMKRAAEEADERDESEEEESEPDSESEDEFEVGKKPGKRAEAGDDEDEEEDGRPSRSERRRQRGEDLVRAERERREAAEQRAEQTQRLLAEALNRALPQQQQQRVDPERARLEQEAKDLRQAQQGLIERHRQLQLEKKLTPDVDAQLQEEAWKLRDRIAQNDILRFAPRQQGPQMSEQQIAAATFRARVMSEHSDVVGNPRAAAAFRAKYIELIQVRGQPDNWQTLETAMDEARRLVGMPPRGGRPAPSAGQKRKYSGVSRGGSGGGGESRQTITMTKAQKAMADAQYGHIKDEKKRYQMWVNRAGARAANRAAEKDA